MRNAATVFLLAITLTAPAALAQVATDGSTGTRVSISGGRIDISQGRRVGANLFHSFDTFNVRSGETATFKDPGGRVDHVIGRVTGSSPSAIDGTLRSEVPRADVWLINPHGITFGANARIDVPASLHVGTADAVRLGDGGVFSATSPAASRLTVAAPESFGFLGASPGRLTVTGSHLEAGSGRTLSLVGGDVSIRGSNAVDADGAPTRLLTAPDGAVNVVAVHGPNTVRPADGATASPATGTIAIAGNARLIVSGEGGSGKVRIRSGALTVENAAITADNLDAAAGTGGIDIQTGALRLSNASLTADAVGAGRGGTVTVGADTLDLRHGAYISSDTYATGNAGAVTVRVRDTALIDAAGSDTYTGISSDTMEDAQGNAGQVTVEARSLVVRNAGVISSDTNGAGNAGAVAVRVTDDLRVTGRGDDSATGITSAANTGSTGHGGSVTVEAGGLEVRKGAQIGSDTYTTGNAGAVDIRVRGRTLVSGDGAERYTGISSDTVSASGQAGAVSLTSGTLEVLDHGSVTSNTMASGNAGPVTVTADDLAVRNGGQIASDTYATGDAGPVRIRVSGRTLISGDGADRYTGISSDTVLSSGNAGAVMLTTGTLAVLNGGAVTSETKTEGNAGSVAVLARDGMRVSGDGTIIGSSSNGRGAGGTVTIRTPILDVDDLGDISAKATSTGQAGDIAILADHRLTVTGGAQISAEAQSGGGGNIGILVRDLIALRDGAITTKVMTGAGNAGNITIDPRYMVLDGTSRILAQAESGDGGRLDFRVGNLFRFPGGVIDASSRFGVSGTVTVEAFSPDFGGELAVLPTRFFDASALLDKPCAARSGGSSLTSRGRGALAADPDRLQAPVFVDGVKPAVGSVAARVSAPCGG